MKMKGFTLIELMIAVAIVAIITSVAYPSYQGYVQQTHRAKAQADLLELAQWMERYFTANGTYIVASGAAAVQAKLPFQYSPKNETSQVDAFYSISVANLMSHSYQLRATPVNSQANDACGALEYDNTGLTTASGAGCW